ncbi:hypothetical protein B0H16DRAFT_1466356 [Mycena metata]|uniref:Uncharacterized protein n=1 Tax=Mycena metata TaxID=1033252 RepID=A0AAD7I9E3_9AGAR|nr:hypothetical protein B0H16DRAFT_1466356 [Mycena metata]
MKNSSSLLFMRFLALGVSAAPIATADDNQTLALRTGLLHTIGVVSSGTSVSHAGTVVKLPNSSKNSAKKSTGHSSQLRPKKKVKARLDIATESVSETENLGAGKSVHVKINEANRMPLKNEGYRRVGVQNYREEHRRPFVRECHIPRKKAQKTQEREVDRLRSVWRESGSMHTRGSQRTYRDHAPKAEKLAIAADS